ncbi:MAG: pitrilysin family protein [Bacteroidia bacterium]|nr:pitrilysin family protein [Bacteroidia bacterium]
MKINDNGRYARPSVSTHKLSNGLRIIHQPFPSEISYCGIVVNTGSRDEFSDEHGMAHFVEHLLFKGTKKRKAHHVINRMENVGGELNAYTTKEETFIYTTFLSEYFERAMELLSDIVFHSTFPENQIQKERDVILDEINSYIDSPSELIFDDFENFLFPNHEIGHYILGTTESLLNLDKEKIGKFVNRQYSPENMVLFSFGKTPFSKVIRLSEQFFNLSHLSHSIFKKRERPLIEVAKKYRVEKDTAQTHVMLGTHAFDMFHPDRYSLYLLNHILGGGSINSRLNNSLREKNGLVYNVESNLALYTDTGLFSIYFACDKKQVGRCLKLIDKELQKLIEFPLSANQLTTAKRQYKGQLGIASENNESIALRMAKSYLHFNHYLPLEEVFPKIDAITSEQIQNLAEKLFISEQLCQLEYF